MSYLLGMVLLPLLMATLVGLRLPKTHSAASRVHLEATPEQVWALITDRLAQPQWRPGLKAVELTEVDGRTGWVEICHRNVRVTFVEVLREPQHRLITRLADAATVVCGQWTYELESEADGTLLTITESANIHHPLLRSFFRFVISYHGTIDVFLIALSRRLGRQVPVEHLSVRHEPDAAPPQC